MNVGVGVRRMTQDLHRNSYSITAVVKNDWLLRRLTMWSPFSSSIDA
jgi:hypothetical protein